MKSLVHCLPLLAIAHAADLQIPLAPGSGEALSLDKIPLLGFGTWNLDKSNASEAVAWAIQTGYRHIDCAAAYGNEFEVGRGIAEGLYKTGLKREDLWITSKLWNNRHGTDLVSIGLDETLEKLGLQYLDLYHMHWPVSESTWGSKSIEYHDTWSAMGLQKAKGKARHLGISNFSPSQLKDLLNHTTVKPDVHQMELHPYLQQNDWLDFHHKHGIHVTAYSPLAGSNPTYDAGNLTQLLNNTVVEKIAKKRKCSPAQVVLKWGMSRGTSVIPKSQHKARISENFGSLECGLRKKDLKKIDKLGKAHHRYNNPSESWSVDLYKGLEDSKGKHKSHS